MKTSFLLKSMLACFLLGSSALALAAHPTPMGRSNNFLINGEYTRGACNVSFPSGSEANYGQFSTPLSPTTLTKLQKIKLSINIHCDSATAVALSFIDNQASSVPPLAKQVIGDGVAFGLGFGQDDISQVGGAYITFRDEGATIDTKQATMTVSADDGASWSTKSWASWETKPNYYVSFHETQDATNENPTAGQDMNATIETTAYLNTEPLFPTEGSVKLKGLATVVINYAH